MAPWFWVWDFGAKGLGLDNNYVIVVIVVIYTRTTMSSSRADPMLGLNILQGRLEGFKYLNQLSLTS